MKRECTSCNETPTKWSQVPRRHSITEKRKQ